MEAFLIVLIAKWYSHAAGQSENQLFLQPMSSCLALSATFIREWWHLQAEVYKY